MPLIRGRRSNRTFVTSLNRTAIMRDSSAIARKCLAAKATAQSNVNRKDTKLPPITLHYRLIKLF